MKAVNTYGLNIIGLRKACGETGNYSAGSGCYDEIFYDRQTGEVWTKYQCSLGQNSWTQYHDPSVIKICNTTTHMTMQQIADSIRDRLDEIAASGC